MECAGSTVTKKWHPVLVSRLFLRTRPHSRMPSLFWDRFPPPSMSRKMISGGTNRACITTPSAAPQTWPTLCSSWVTAPTRRDETTGSSRTRGARIGAKTVMRWWLVTETTIAESPRWPACQRCDLFSITFVQFNLTLTYRLSIWFIKYHFILLTRYVRVSTLCVFFNQ